MIFFCHLNNISADFIYRQKLSSILFPEGRVSMTQAELPLWMVMNTGPFFQKAPASLIP